MIENAKKVKIEKPTFPVMESFNKEAKKQNSKYRIIILHKNYLHLSVWWCPFWFNPFTYQIDEWDGVSSFIGPIPNKVFRSIEPILNKIPEKWDVKFL